MCNKLDKLVQVWGKHKEKDTLRIIFRSKIPVIKTMTHHRALCDIRTQNKDTHRVCLMICGNLTTYQGYLIAATVEFTVVKEHWNDAIFYPNTQHMCMGMEIFYPNILLEKKNTHKSIKQCFQENSS